jgi:hypothetical protein
VHRHWLIASRAPTAHLLLLLLLLLLLDKITTDLRITPSGA